MGGKKKPDVKLLYGTLMADTTVVPECEEESRMLSFMGKDADGREAMFDMSEKMCSKHILLIGSIGTGKTNTFYHIIEYMDANMTQDDVMLIFDTKGDFYSDFYLDGADYIIGNSSMFLDKTSYWNIFREIEHGGVLIEEKKLLAKEMAKSLFENRKNTSQPFFSSAATDLFAKVLIGTMRRELWDLPEYIQLEERLMRDRNDIDAVRKQHLLFEKNVGRLNNRFLTKEIFFKWDGKDYIELLDEFEEFRSAKTYIGDGSSNQALGVFGELNSMVNDYFVGIFGDYRPGRDVSLRELIHNKDGKKIFIEYDLSIGQVLAPIYSLLIDLGLKEALGRERTEGNTFLIIDEYSQLPVIHHMTDAVNFGRSLGIKLVAGIQTIKQLEDIYGETGGQVIASGFSNVFAFRMTDEPSRKYVSELFGKNYVSISYWDESGKEQVAEREGNTVEDWDTRSLPIGMAVIGLTGYPPFLFRFKEFET